VLVTFKLLARPYTMTQNTQRSSDAVMASLKADLERHPFEATLSELGPMVSKAIYAIENIKE
jgi:hypothetical protein